MPDTGTASAKQEADPVRALLELFADPKTAGLSAREIRRRTGFDHRYIVGFRVALDAIAWSPPPPAAPVAAKVVTSPSGLPRAPCWPPSGTRSTPGHTVAGEPPALNSWDCWVMATEREKTKFVDAVGLFHLLAAAPADHRDAFLKQVRQEPESPALKYLPVDLPPDLSIPNFLRRIRGAATC
jgi:hypothetical protein